MPRRRQDGPAKTATGRSQNPVPARTPGGGPEGWNRLAKVPGQAQAGTLHVGQSVASLGFPSPSARAHGTAQAQGSPVNLVSPFPVCLRQSPNKSGTRKPHLNRSSGLSSDAWKLWRLPSCCPAQCGYEDLDLGQPLTPLGSRMLVWRTPGPLQQCCRSSQLLQEFPRSRDTLGRPAPPPHPSSIISLDRASVPAQAERRPPADSITHSGGRSPSRLMRRDTHLPRRPSAPHSRGWGLFTEVAPANAI